ncbi:MAG: hypothetical protein AAGH43_08255, partial [Pseudomonadota bacterium]
MSYWAAFGDLSITSVYWLRSIAPGLEAETPIEPDFSASCVRFPPIYTKASFLGMSQRVREADVCSCPLMGWTDCSLIAGWSLDYACQQQERYRMTHKQNDELAGLRTVGID